MNENNTQNLWQNMMSDKSIKRLFTLILIVVFILLFGKMIAEFKSLSYIGQDASLRNTITVSGKGEMTVVPDVAKFSFAVVYEAGDVGTAQETVSERMNSLLSYLDDFGVNKKDIKTINYSINPRYDYRQTEIYPSGTRTFAGYEVSQYVEVKLSETSSLGEVIGGLGERGATNISNVRFTVEDEEKIRQEARKLAILDAKEKAKVLARDLGVSLDNVVNFNEGGNGVFYGEEYAFDTLRGMGGGATPDLPAGENEVIVNVSITYSIR